MSVFDDNQLEMINRLQAQAWFKGVPMVQEKKGDYEQFVRETIAKAAAPAPSPDGVDTSKAGLALVMLTPRGRNVALDRPRIEPVQVAMETHVLIYENVSVNIGAMGWGKRGLDVVQNLIFYLSGFSPARGMPPLQFIDFDSNEKNGIVVWTAIFRAQKVIREPIT